MTIAALRRAFPQAWIDVGDHLVGRMDNAPRLAIEPPATFLTTPKVGPRRSTWSPRRGIAIERPKDAQARRWLSWAVASVWIHQGLWAKILGQDTRHTEIVGYVPFIGRTWARSATVAIGTAEVAIALWVLSNRRPVAAATTQTLMLAGMNAGGLALSLDRIPEPRRLLARNLGFLALVWAAAAPGRSR